jgi:hypothetical protein
MKNNSTTPFHIDIHNKIAQFIFKRASTPMIKLKPTLPQSSRGSGGFGSSNTSTPINNNQVKTFCLNTKEVLMIQRCLSRKVVFCRVSRHQARDPIINPTTTSTTDKTTSPYLEPMRLRPTQQSPKQKETTITHHPIDPSDSTPVQKIFQMSVPKTPPAPPVNQPDTPSTIPPLPLPVDRTNSSLPQVITMSQDDLSCSIRFLNTALLLKHMSGLGTRSVQVQSVSPNPSLDPGLMASI